MTSIVATAEPGEAERAAQASCLAQSTRTGVRRALIRAFDASNADAYANSEEAEPLSVPPKTSKHKEPV